MPRAFFFSHFQFSFVVIKALHAIRLSRKSEKLERSDKNLYRDGKL